MVVVLKRTEIWSQDEINVVKLHYDGTQRGIESIVQLIKDKCGTYRTCEAVRHKASCLGLTHRKGYWWTKEQEQKLEELVGHYTVEQIASKLKRTQASIHHKLDDLGLSTKERCDWYSMTDVCDIFGVCDDAFHKWIKEKKLKVEQYANSNVYKVELDELKRFICRYPRELTGRNVDLCQIVTILTAEC